MTASSALYIGTLRAKKREELTRAPKRARPIASTRSHLRRTSHTSSARHSVRAPWAAYTILTRILLRKHCFLTTFVRMPAKNALRS
jgi:hypothetical protein